MTEYVGSDMFVSGGFTLNGEIISFCLSEICGETLIDHIEKALTDYEGIYPATVQEFAKTFAQTSDISTAKTTREAEACAFPSCNISRWKSCVST